MSTLVLLPGMDGTGQLFTPLIAEIASNVSVQVIRYPVNSIQSYAQLTDFVRQSLPADGEYVLLGESFSGPIAIAIAAELPPRLKGLVLCCSFVTNPRPYLSVASPLLRVIPMNLASMPFAMESLLGRFATEPLCKSLREAIRSVTQDVLRARLQAVVSINVKKELAKIAVPILYLKASHDRLVPGRASQEVCRIQPNTRVVEVDGPHFLLQSNPRASATHIDRFITDVQNAV